MTRENTSQSRDNIFYEMSTCRLGFRLCVLTCLVRVGYIVPENYRFCRNVRRDIRLPKLLRDVGHVYGFFTKDINDRESIVPIAPQIRRHKGTD